MAKHTHVWAWSVIDIDLQHLVCECGEHMTPDEIEARMNRAEVIRNTLNDRYDWMSSRPVPLLPLWTGSIKES